MRGTGARAWSNTDTTDRVLTMRATIAIAALSALALTGCSLETEPTPEPSPTESAEPADTGPQAIDAPNVVGQTLDEARDALDGYEIEEIDATGEDRAVFSPKNWFVTDQTTSENTVLLTIENERDAAEAERAAEREQAAAEEAAALEAIGIDAIDAKQACQEFADDTFIYGGKLHTILGVIAETPLTDEGQWFIKVEATITNEYGTDMDAVVECYVSGDGGIAEVQDFIVY